MRRTADGGTGMRPAATGRRGTKDDWMRTHIRQVHMDFHMPEFPPEAIRNFDAEEFVGHLRRGRVNMAALFGKCHFGNSFYDTRVGHKHAGLPNDFLREAAEECRRHGIRTLAYYSLCCDRRAYEHHPHWRAMDAQGVALPISGCWGPVCVNTPYREELVLPQLEEIAAGYPVDGFFIDIPTGSQCFCPYCRRKFEILHGRPLDTSVPETERLAFLYASTTRLLRELRAICERHNPDLKIVTNRAGRLDAPRAFRDANDYGVWESQPHANYLSHSFAVRAVRTSGRPAQVMSVRFYQGWGDLTLKPAAQMTTEFAAMIGNGGVASSGDQVNVDGTLQPPVYDMFAKAFGFVEERETVLRGAEAVRDTAILAPIARPDTPAPGAIGPEMTGAHKILVESHIQFDILESLDLDRLAGYRRILLTEPGSFAPEVFPRLREWVARGGTLVVAGGATIDGAGTFHLQDVLGIEYLEPSVFSVCHFRPAPAVRGEADDLPLQCRGRSFKVLPRGAETLADYIDPQIESTDTYAFRHPCAPPSAAPSRYPFATANAFGRGRAVYIAGSIFRVYWETNHHWLRQFVAGLWHHLDPEPLYRVGAPSTVEANLMRRPDGDLLLNLIHYQPGHQSSAQAIPSIEKVHPLRDIPCAVKVAGAVRAILEPEGIELACKRDGAYVRFVVPRLEYLAIVRIASAGKRSRRAAGRP